MKNILIFPGVEYDHYSEPNKKTENWKVKFVQEKKVTISDEIFCHKSVPNSHNENVERFQRIFFFFISFLVFNGKLLSLHNLVKSELFYLLQIWRYEQNKGTECP